jgi:hypothetical protein
MMAKTIKEEKIGNITVVRSEVIRISNNRGITVFGVGSFDNNKGVAVARR